MSPWGLVDESEPAASRRGREHASRWWESFYWRVGAGFVAFVVAVVMTQSVIFTYRVERMSAATPAPPAGGVASRPSPWRQTHECRTAW